MCFETWLEAFPFRVNAFEDFGIFGGKDKTVLIFEGLQALLKCLVARRVTSERRDDGWGAWFVLEMKFFGFRVGGCHTNEARSVAAASQRIMVRASRIVEDTLYPLFSRLSAGSAVA